MTVRPETEKKRAKAKMSKAKPSSDKAWSRRGLAKQGRSPLRERLASDTIVSDDWLDFSDAHESPLFWVDISPESQLAALQERLTSIEGRAVDLLKAPRRILGRFKNSLIKK